MKTCSNCGVQVEDELDECPLCGEPITEEKRRERERREERENLLRPGVEAEPSEQTVRSAKIWLFEMVTLVAFTAAIIVFATDFAYEFTLSWSPIPLLAIGFLYLFVASIIGLARHAVALLAVETLLVAGFLLALDLLLGSERWFLTMALPITLLIALITGVTATVAVKLRLNTLQTVAVVFLATGLFVMGLELVISWSTTGSSIVSWSIIAFACALSLFFLILFINKRLRERHAEYRKIFHV